MRKIRVIKTISRIASVLLLVALVTPILTELAYRERGYVGFGGEWLLIISIGVVAYLVLRKKDDKKGGEENK